MTTLRPLRSYDRSPIEMILRGVQVFNELDVSVALELVDHALVHGDEEYSFIVAEHEGRVAGYACWGKASMSAGVFDLYWIVVDKSLHGGGVGQKLLAHAEHDARAKGGHTLLIETEGSEPYFATRRFYLLAGYNKVGCVEDYYGRSRDKVMFSKRLDR